MVDLVDDAPLGQDGTYDPITGDAPPPIDTAGSAAAPSDDAPSSW